MNVIPFPRAVPEAVQDVLLLPIAPQACCGLRFSLGKKAIQALSPSDALAEVGRHKGLAGVELGGPGDPLATVAATLETIALLKSQYPTLEISLTTLGIGGGQCAADLAVAGLTSINLLVDALDTATAEKLYAWIRPGKKTLPLEKTVGLLLDEQRKTVQVMAASGIGVAVRTTVYPGINAHQVVTIAEAMKELGAKEMELLPFSPGPGQADVPPPATRVHMEQIGKLTSPFLATTIHQVPVTECGCDCGPDCGTGSACGCSAAAPLRIGLPKPSAERPRVAVASATGMDVDLHLGQAKTLLIYGPRADGLTCLLETRQAPAAGSGETRWEQLADILHDCFVLLAASAGQRPREVLASRGIRVLVTEENIEGAVDVLYGGGKKSRCSGK